MTGVNSEGSASERDRPTRESLVDILLVATVVVLHVGLAIYYKDARGLDILANPGFRDWDWWWQTVPKDLLEQNLWQSIYYLHSQPPLFNIFGALFFNFFPQNPMDSMHIVNILLGGATIGMCYGILKLTTRNSILAFGTCLLFALSPGLILYEAYILYDIQTTFLVTLSVFFIALCARKKSLLTAGLFILSVNLLILTRASYHLMLIAVALLLLILMMRKHWRSILLIGVCLSIVSIFWYTKNLFLFDFFGASSWQGLSLWKIAATRYSQDELNDLSDQGRLDPMLAEQRVFGVPSSFVLYGFDQASAVPVLAQDDLHNINVVNISKAYLRGALELIRLDPNRYFQTVLEAYKLSSLPISQFKHHPINSEKISLHVSLYTKYIDAQIIGRYFGRDYLTIHLFLLPTSLVLYLILVLNKYWQQKNIFQTIKDLAPESWMAFLILYSTAVSIVMEIGENNRYRFYIENLVWMLSIIVIYKVIFVNMRITRFGKHTNHSRPQHG